MGFDLAICIQVREGSVPDISGIHPVARDQFGLPCEKYPIEATHEIDCSGRYWSPDSRRGDFPTIAKMLLECLGDYAVERVWYGNDGPFYEEMTADRLCELVRAFCNPPLEV